MRPSPLAPSARAASLAVAVSLLAAAVHAAEPALWLRYPAISPDGQTIAFAYRGDLWTVPVSGGVATPLTVDPGYETNPVWSPDGSRIGYAADRYGNFDVFVVAASGGVPTRLTTHSADERPTSFAPDGGSVLFAAARLDAVTNVQFPSGAQPELYSVGLDGGLPRQVLTTPAEHAVWDRAGARLVYTDRKGYEMEWRKHDTSSFSRDLWLYERAGGRHTRLTGAGVDDRQPVWSEDEAALFFLSERSGSFNVWRLDLARALTAGGGEAAMAPAAGALAQVTAHMTHPVRFLSASRNGDLCYAYDGELCVRPAGAAESHKLTVTVGTAPRVEGVEWTDVASEVSELALAPSGKEIAFVARGEVFVTSADHETTRRITDTPEQERSVSFSPDGRSLLYAAERGGSWNLYRSDLTDGAEPSFFNATAIVEKAVLATPEETFQPLFSPDGKQIAYLENRTTLKVLELASGKSRVVLPGDRNYSYSDGDQWFQWSPDGQWLLVQMLSAGRWSAEIGLAPASGQGEVVNLSRSGYEDYAPRFDKGGAMVYWATDRQGMRRHAGWGSQDDVYAMFLTQAAWDRFRLSEAELEQLKAREEKEKKAKEKGKAKAEGDKDGKDGKGGGKANGADEKAEEDADEKPKLADPVALELDGRDDRVARLTRASSAIADLHLTPDGEKLLVLARFEKGFDLWLIEPRKGEAKLLAGLEAERAGGLAIDKEGKKAYLLADGKLTRVELESGKVQPVALDRQAVRMRLDRAAERAHLFEHAWRQTREKFYQPALHGVDWDAMKAAYARFLPHVDNGRDWAELVSELQGELNASHTGGRYRARPNGAVETASLGFFPRLDHTGPGIAIAEVLAGGPLEKAGAEVVAGVVIESIDGTAIAAGDEWAPLLDHKAGAPVRLALLDPAKSRRWQVVVKPITRGEEGDLLYERWVRSRRAEVDRLSGGRLGYAHIRSMDDGSYREVFDEIFGLAVGKQGIVLDTRFNGGGNLVEALTSFLTGSVYARNIARGQQVGSEPSLRWTRPSVVVMNEGNYSDAHCFPAAYKALAIGETVGMPVPGTCTSVWWERLQDPTLVFGIPQVGLTDPTGDYLENKHLAPDHEVDNDPALEAEGRDQQLEKAVEVLLAKVGG